MSAKKSVWLSQMGLLFCVIFGLLFWWGLIALLFWLGFQVIGLMLVIMAFGTVMYSLYQTYRPVSK